MPFIVCCIFLILDSLPTFAALDFYRIGNDPDSLTLLLCNRRWNGEYQLNPEAIGVKEFRAVKRFSYMKTCKTGEFTDSHTDTAHREYKTIAIKLDGLSVETDQGVFRFWERFIEHGEPALLNVTCPDGRRIQLVKKSRNILRWEPEFTVDSTGHSPVSPMITTHPVEQEEPGFARKRISCLMPGKFNPEPYGMIKEEGHDRPMQRLIPVEGVGQRKRSHHDSVCHDCDNASSDDADSGINVQKQDHESVTSVSDASGVSEMIDTVNNVVQCPFKRHDNGVLLECGELKGVRTSLQFPSLIYTAEPRDLHPQALDWVLKIYSVTLAKSLDFSRVITAFLGGKPRKIPKTTLEKLNILLEEKG